jgi:hypothetical protein
MLQRVRRANGQKIVHLTDRRGDLRRRDAITDTPARYRISFRQRIYNDRPLAHTVQRRHANVFGPLFFQSHIRNPGSKIVCDMFVNLIRKRQRVKLSAQAGDKLEFVA